MTNSEVEFQEKMRLLAASFVENLPEKTSKIEVMWKQLQAGWDAEMLQMLHRTIHGLAISSKTFGFLEISNVASALEQELKSLVQKKIPISEQPSAQINEQVLALIQVTTKPTPSHNQESVSAFKNLSMATQKSSISKKIFVVDDDIEAAQELAMQLCYYDYEVEVFSQSNEFKLAVKKTPEAIILMDVESTDDRLGGIKLMKEIQRDLAQPAQVIFISAHDDLLSRLGAMRTGGIAYFTKPINSTELIDQLDSLTSSQPQENFRVLIVGDSPALLTYHSTVLEQAGMIVNTVRSPMDVIESLLEFNPDLILIDLYMSECSGIELAKVIRQLSNFVSTPIVYLSSENDFNTQLEASSLAGNDFLVKSIDPQKFISAVTSHIQRDRLLRSFMERDSLTGLFNHTSITEQFDREVVRSNRLNTPLSFAMVDIDSFKSINDTYGHSAGDRVIKSLAKLLKQRLRGTDIVGRYGGEEFAVIMTDTDASKSIKVMDQIRQVFSRLIHLNEGNEFSVSFSCGVADIVHFSDTVSMAAAADEALHQAKQGGRNRVVLNEVSSATCSIDSDKN